MFVAGDYSKAEVMSVQVLTTFDLLTDAGEKGPAGVDHHKEEWYVLQLDADARRKQNGGHFAAYFVTGITRANDE